MNPTLLSLTCIRRHRNRHHHKLQTGQLPTDDQCPTNADY